jgi:hypothetical protein
LQLQTSTALSKHDIHYRVFAKEDDDCQEKIERRGAELLRAEPHRLKNINENCGLSA